MKKTLLVISAAILPAIFFASGQQASLPESRRSSQELFVYKLNEKDVRNLYLKETGLDESMLHTFVLSCAGAEDIPALPRGNYIMIRAVGSSLEYSGHTVDNFHYSVVRDEKAMLFISDTLGNVIENAVVRRGLKRLRFDETTRTYNTARIGDGKIVEINNDGVFHYIDFDDRYSYRNDFFSNIWSDVKYEIAEAFSSDRKYLLGKYSGFIVFSKPKYKPGETVRFKAYIERKKRPCTDEVEVVLFALYPVRIDTVLTSLAPYRPGMYEWEFPLSDSLNLRLDRDYDIVLREKRKRADDLRRGFRYEDYQLGRVTFEARTERGKYVRGDSVEIRFSARDENDMPVYDGCVDITVRPASYRHVDRYYSDRAFIPDEIWKHTFDMNGKAAGELVLPDSIFVDNADIYYDVRCTFLDSGNEKHDENLTLRIDTRDRFVDFKVERGILTVRELADGESVSGEARLTAYNSEGNIVYESTVTLPHSMPLIWMADEYEVTTETASGDLNVKYIDAGNIIGYRFFRDNGKIRLTVDNPAGFPFWYTIRKNRSIIAKGYATELDYSCKESAKSGYTMQLSYLLGEKAREIQKNLPYGEKNIRLEVTTPTLVYPGQKADIDVRVTDRKGRPVRNADITAYAFTSKFGLYPSGVEIPGKSVFAKHFANKWYDTSDAATYSKKGPMEWNVWRDRMGLDSIEYYKFLYPEVFYYYSEKDPDGITQISPYAVIDGTPQGVHILWIDEEPHYFNKAQQLDVYSFPVAPGYHTLTLRTYDREITAGNVYVAEGDRTIVSISGSGSEPLPDTMRRNGEPPLTVTVKEYGKKERGVLSEREMTALKDRMITVDRTLGTVSLPDDYQETDMPATINAGGAFYYLGGTGGFRHKYNNRDYTANPVLVGPFPYRGFFTGGKNLASLYADSLLVGTFEIEGGYRYSVWDGYLKQTNWEKTPFSSDIRPFTQNISFARSALTPEKIRELFHEQMSGQARKISGLLMPASADMQGKCRLDLKIDAEGADKPVMIRLSKPEHEDSVGYICYGGTSSLYQLPEGDCRIDLIFADTTRYSTMVTLRPGGLNYLRIKPEKAAAVDSIGRMVIGLLYSRLLITAPENPLRAYELYPPQSHVAPFRNSHVGGYVSGRYTGGATTGVVYDSSGSPLAYASIAVEGTDILTITGIDGKFALPESASGNLSVSHPGYIPFTVRLTAGYDYRITLIEDSQSSAMEIIVSGMSARSDGQSRQTVSLMSSEDGEFMIANMVSGLALEGRVPGVNIRGSSMGGDAVPLIIVDGVPYDGALSDISADKIVSINVIKDASTAIYGSRATNGVIMVYTKEGTASAENEFPEGWSGANSLRTNFHDDAFWRPNLTTGKDGTVTFEVTYPDDITRWNANFIAVGGRKQLDAAQLSIRSFKPINAQLSVPQFAVSGDSLNVVGRLTNHSGDSVKVRRTIEVQGIVGEENISMSNSHVDNIPVVANEPDSIRITYSLAMESGYFDGERRAIPVYKPGVLESHGEFAVLGGGTDCRFQTDPALGAVTVHAEASAIKSFLDEIDRVDSYPYFCNEQTASKIKVLLLKKRILLMSGAEFGDDKKINELIRRLERNRNGDGMWGWWNKDATEMWITRQVVGAMLAAEADGYKVNFDKRATSDTFIRELNRRLSDAGNSNGNEAAKGESLDLLELLGKLGAQIDYAQYLQFISSLPDVAVGDRLRCMELSLAFGVGEPQIDTLLSLATETLMGAMYWSENKDREVRPAYFGSPYATDTGNTLTAYRILRASGGYDAELERIRNYFFEIRRSGSWSNTYESSRILATIVPDMLQKDEKGLSDAAITLNGKRYGEFPLTVRFEAGETVEVAKTGSLPVFFTLYQQAWSETPERASEGFSIETAFYCKDDVVTTLEAGKSVELRAKVTVDSDAEYVMIEVPIPAGCSYESKNQSGIRSEIHREYHKEKVAIFCNRLPKGAHEFTIKLTPRYTGVYHLNPAKAELMYYPTFFGREEIRLHGIE